MDQSSGRKPDNTPWHSRSWWTGVQGIFAIVGVLVAIIGVIAALFVWRFPRSPNSLPSPAYTTFATGMASSDQHPSGQSVPPTSSVIFRDDFHTPDLGWTAPDGHGTLDHTSDALRVEPDGGGWAMWVHSPPHQAANNVRIVATAYLISSAGGGGWGLWCRGTRDGAKRFEFSVTNGQNAYIKDASGNSLVHETLPSFDIFQPHTVTGDCIDADGGVQLAMTVDGGSPLSASATAAGGQILGPGDNGVHGFSFVELKNRPDVRFTLYEEDRLQ